MINFVTEHRSKSKGIWFRINTSKGRCLNDGSEGYIRVKATYISFKFPVYYEVKDCDNPWITYYSVNENILLDSFLF